MFEHLEQLLLRTPERKVVSEFRKFAVNYARHHPKRKSTINSCHLLQTTRNS